MRIHASVGELPRQTIFALARLAQSVRPGRPRPHHDASGTLTMTRTVDGQVILHRGPLPDGPFVAAPSVTAPAPDIATWGRKLWGELFREALTLSDSADIQKHAAGIERRIPCNTPPANCRTHWRAWLAANPPSGDYFTYLVGAKNAIAERLGKATISPDQARESIGASATESSGSGD